MYILENENLIMKFEYLFSYFNFLLIYT